MDTYQEFSVFYVQAKCDLNLFYNFLCITQMTQYAAYLGKYVVIWSDKIFTGIPHALRI